MAVDASLPDWASLPSARLRRWDEVLSCLGEVLTPGPRLVVVNGHHHASAFADRLTVLLRSLGQERVRLSNEAPVHDEDGWHSEHGPRAVVSADGARWRAQPPAAAWDVVMLPRD